MNSAKKKFTALAAALAVWTAVSASLSFGADNGDGTYTNPILFADYPDSEVIRVGDDFYYQSSSFHLVPGNPVMHSRDLVNWEPAGFSIPDYKILEDPRYDLDGEHGNAYGAGSWAPSLRYHDGMFYSVCYVWDNRPENKTGVDGVFLVSRAENVAGPWKMNAIRAKMYDPGLFFDDDGRVYVFHGQNDLKVTELDADLTKVVTPEKTIIRGTICEGTHAYKIDGKYYLFNPGGGKQHCFRSDSVYGPYEHKVVCDSQLTYEGSGLHQGGLVQLKNGDWWAIIFQDHGKLGRIPFLLPVEWKDGWPEVKPVLTHKKPAVDLESPITKLWREAVGNPDQQWRSDSFSTDKLGLQWQWNHHPAADGWSLTERPGWLRLKPRRTSSAIRETQNVLVQQIFGPGDSAQVVLDYSGLKDGDIAGLGLFSQHCTFVAAVRENGKTRLAVMRQMFKDGKYTTEELQSVDLDNLDPDNETNTTKKGQVVIRADVPFLQYAVEYSYSIDGGQYFRTFDQLAEPGLYFAKLGMPCEFFSDWLAIRYCLFCYSRKGIGGHADFDDFKTKRKPFDYSRTTETIFHAQLCDAYQNMSKPAFVWVSDPDAPPNLYLKWPDTSRIGTGIHDAASWTEAFEAKERRWLLFREVPFQASNGAGFTIRASGKGRIVLRACRGKVGGYVEIRNGYLSCTPGTSDLSGECEAPQALPPGSLPMKEIPLRRGLTGEFAGENGEEVEIGSIQVDSEKMKSYLISAVFNPTKLIPDPRPGPHGYMYRASAAWPVRIVLEPEEGSTLRFRSMEVVTH